MFFEKMKLQAWWFVRRLFSRVRQKPIDFTRMFQVIDGSIVIFGEKPGEIEDIAAECRQALVPWLKGAWLIDVLTAEHVTRRRSSLAVLCGAPFSGAAVPMVQLTVVLRPAATMHLATGRRVLSNAVDVLVQSSGMRVVDLDWRIQLRTADKTIHDVTKIMAAGGLHHMLGA